MWLDAAVVAGYLLLLAWIGLTGGKKVRRAADFGAGGGYGTAVLFASLSASYIGGGYSAGNAAAAFEGGIGTALALCGFGVSMVLTGRFLAPGVARFDGCATVGDILARQYGEAAGVAGGLCAFLCCAGVVGAQVETMGNVCRQLFGLPETAEVLIGCGVVMLYAAGGGVQAVIRADLIQFAMLAVGMPLLLVLALRQAGGLAAVVRDTPPSFWDPYAGRHPLAFWCLFVSMACGEALAPPYTQRLLSGRSAAVTARATRLSGWFAFPFFAVTALLGITARSLQVCRDGRDALPALVMEVLPAGARGLLMAAMVSVALSAADGFLNSAAVSLVGDVLTPLRRTPAPDRTVLRQMRLVTLLTGLLAAATALLLPDVLGILAFSYAFWAPLLLVPLAAALRGTRADGRCFFAAAAAGLAGMTAWNLLLYARTGVDGTVPGLLCNLAMFVCCARRRAKIDRKPAA